MKLLPYNRAWGMKFGLKLKYRAEEILDNATPISHGEEGDEPGTEFSRQGGEDARPRIFSGLGGRQANS